MTSTNEQLAAVMGMLKGEPTYLGGDGLRDGTGSWSLVITDDYGEDSPALVGVANFVLLGGHASPTVAVSIHIPTGYIPLLPLWFPDDLGLSRQAQMDRKPLARIPTKPHDAHFREVVVPVTRVRRIVIITPREAFSTLAQQYGAAECIAHEYADRVLHEFGIA